MNSLKIFLLTLVSFILGAMLAHASSAKAHSGFTTIHVERALIGGDLRLPPADGSTVVGFSCVPGPGGEKAEYAACYVATQ